MSIFVGTLMPVAPNWNWPHEKAAHLFADTDEELHDFAFGMLHLRSSWFQPKSIPHYDLTKSKRLLAIRKGAIPFKDAREEGKYIQERRLKK